MKVESIEEHALHAHIRKRTVRLLDFTHKSQGGSGVTIQLENRFFVATAAHVIPEGHDIRVLDKANQFRTFENWQLDKQNDVGLLEVSAEVANAMDREFATRLMLRWKQTEAWETTRIAYPGQSIETQESVRGRTRHLRHSFHTLTLISNLIPKPSLCAIQTGANASRHWARGIQVSHWLKLVVQSYPELTSIADQLD